MFKKIIYDTYFRLNKSTLSIKKSHQRRSFELKDLQLNNTKNNKNLKKTSDICNTYQLFIRLVMTNLFNEMSCVQLFTSDLSNSQPTKSLVRPAKTFDVIAKHI